MDLARRCPPLSVIGPPSPGSNAEDGIGRRAAEVQSAWGLHSELRMLLRALRAYVTSVPLREPSAALPPGVITVGADHRVRGAPPRRTRGSAA
ncbi:hypothetical protein GCM10027168_10430 [Streptomyces capparidis]